MRTPRYMTKKEVEGALGFGFDDEGLITVDIHDINEVIDVYITKITNK